MLPRPIRAPIVLLASLGLLLAAAAIPAAAQFETPASDEGDRATLPRRVSIAPDGGEPLQLGRNLQDLRPATEPDGDEDGNGNGEGDAEGRPEWVPGPPPWVRALLTALFANGFPWGTDDFPPATGTEDGEDEAENGAAVAAPPAWVPGPPPGVPVPPQAGDDDGGDDDEGDGPPAWVPPAGGPPDTIPAPPAPGGGRP